MRGSLDNSVVPGDVHDPDQVSEGSESSGDDVGEDDGGGASSSSKRIVTSLNLDDVSSSEEEDEGNDGDEGEDGDAGGDEHAAISGSGRGGKRVHWGGEEEEREDEDGGGLGGGKRLRQQQANVFAGVADEGADAVASVEEQMMQLDEQDAKARKAGGGVAGQGELRRAREALR